MIIFPYSLQITSKFERSFGKELVSFRARFARIVLYGGLRAVLRLTGTRRLS